MLPREKRIPKVLIEDILKNGTSYHGPFFSLKIAKNNAFLGKTSNFAVVVSKKVAGTAVKRNFLKRRTKYVINKLIPRLASGLSVIVLYKRDISDLKYSVFEAETEKTFRNAGLIK